MRRFAIPSDVNSLLAVSVSILNLHSSAISARRFKVLLIAKVVQYGPFRSKVSRAVIAVDAILENDALSVPS